MDASVAAGLALACLLLAGLLRAEWAYAAGWVVQGAAIALGSVIPLMFVLGAIFALLWGAAVSQRSPERFGSFKLLGQFVRQDPLGPALAGHRVTAADHSVQQ